VSIAAAAEYGGSTEAVQYHYDVGREFYQLWLDPGMTYSCALFQSAQEGESLEGAQERKIDFHLDAAAADQARRLLDIGCGWGALLRRAAGRNPAQQRTGLTLSEDQAACVRDLALPNTQVLLESWTAHQPQYAYDAIVSIGALEHFAKPEDTVPQKIAVYRDFLERCDAWLAPGGRMSLQTIAYGTLRREDASEFINSEIFPSADLPTLGEIIIAADGLFEIASVRNDRLHYARTFAAWAENLRRRRGEATRLVGEDVTARYERYLTQSSVGFLMGKINLLRLALRPVRRKWSILAQA
jgi:cyclopropane-fatty-acyl-phospholipid synthase